MGQESLPEREWTQATLPLKLGGLGLKDPMRVAAPARVAGILGYVDRAAAFGYSQPLACPAPDLSRRLTELQPWLGAQSEPLRSWLIGGAPKVEPDHTKQKWWSKQLYEAVREGLPRGASERDQCRLRLQGKPHSSAWLGASPHKGQVDRPSGAQYQLLLRLWLGLPVVPGYQPVECPRCGGSADIVGDHFVCCSRAAITKRHNHLRDTLASIFCFGGFSAQTEVVIGERTRPADVAVTGFEARPIHVDLTIAHPLRPSESKDPELVKRHLLSREEAKPPSTSRPPREQAGCSHQQPSILGAGRVLPVPHCWSAWPAAWQAPFNAGIAAVTRTGFGSGSALL